MTSHLFTRVRPFLPRRLRALPAVAALALFAGACSSDAPTAVFDPDAPARLSLDASVRFQTTTGAALGVLASYQRANETLVRIDSQSIALTEAASQQVPITIDLGACLRDPLRAGRAGAPPAADECVVTFELALITSGQEVDRQTLRNLSMRPGATTTVNEPVTLEEVGVVQLVLPPANVIAENEPLRLETTRTMTIGATVVDGAGRVITRPVVWSTDNAAVATVSATGVVTGVAPGTARIGATAGILGQSVLVRVVPLPQTVTITAGTGSSGTGTVVSTPAGINCTVTGTTTSGTCTANFPGDASVSLAMSTGTNTTFSGWGGDCTGTTACTFVTSQPRNVSVNLRSFRTLTVSASGSGNGTITAPGGVINCVWRFGSASSGPCTAQIADGTEITLTATPESGSQFVGWNSECTTVNGTSCTFTMNANKAPVATFRALTTYRITGGLGSGAGTVTSSPSGMACEVNGTAVSGTCALTVPAGTNVSLIATGTSGSTWRVWDGVCANATATCATVAPELPGEFAVRVGFDQLVTLQVDIAPTSTGTGQLNGTGFFFCSINGTTPSVPCQQSYPVGTSVTVTASRIGYTDFMTWGGACASAGSNASCTLTLTSNQSATVRFEAVPTATLTTNLEGFGGYALRLLHPYQGEQGCARSASADFNTPTTTCSLTVPVRRDFTLAFSVPGPDWYYYYSSGLCSDQFESTLPCVRSVTGDVSTITYAYPYSEGEAPRDVSGPATMRVKKRTATDTSTAPRRNIERR